MAPTSATEDNPIVRKVQLAGGSTFTVSLPKAWAERQGLEPGSKLWLYALEDRIVVAPDTHSPVDRATTIEADGLDPAALGRRIRAAYTAGSDEIVVAGGEGLSTDQRRAATDALAGLVGVEVERGDRSRVAARSMLDASAVSLEQTLLQLRRLALSMYREAIEALVEDDGELAAGVERRTDDVERFVALVGRQFHAALVDVGEVERLETGRAAAFRHYRTARALGEVARDAAAVAGVAAEQSSPPPEGVAERLRNCGTLVRAVFGDAFGDAPESVDEGGRKLADAIAALDDELAAAEDPDCHRYGRVCERLRATGEAVEAIAQAGFQGQLTDGDDD